MGIVFFLFWKVANILENRIECVVNHMLWNMWKKFELDSLKIVEAFAFWISQNAQKVKVKKYRVEKSLTRYSNGKEIYIWPDKWLYNSDRDLILQRIIDIVFRLMGEISNFYNFSPRIFIFGSHIPPIITIHDANFHWFLYIHFKLWLFYFWK